MNGTGTAPERPSSAPPLNQLTHRAGPPLTTNELAKMIGVSSTFIREEIRGGYLQAVRIGRGRKTVYRIPVSEARRYVRELGLL